MAKKKTETAPVTESSQKILSISANDFQDVFGLVTTPMLLRHPARPDQELVREMLESSSLAYREREEIEEDESIKQLIPYVVFKRGTEVFRYHRTQKCGEDRLRGKCSLGVGGHIEEFDGEPGVEAYCTALNRETKEEVGFTFPPEIDPMSTIAGVLYDPTEAVGRVHVGIVHVVQLGSRGALKIQDEAMDEGRFIHRVYAKQRVSEFEIWSQLVLPIL